MSKPLPFQGPPLKTLTEKQKEFLGVLQKGERELLDQQLATTTPYTPILTGISMTLLVTALYRFLKRKRRVVEPKKTLLDEILELKRCKRQKIGIFLTYYRLYLKQHYHIHADTMTSQELIQQLGEKALPFFQEFETARFSRDSISETTYQKALTFLETQVAILKDKSAT